MSDAIVIKNRYDFVLYFEVKRGNPNGDPDAANRPRQDPETGKGYMTDVSLKSKIRRYVSEARENAAGYDIYVRSDATLNENDCKAFKALGIDNTAEAIKAAKDGDPDLDKKIRDWMCLNFFDTRAFGAVMTTFVKNKINCGQVRGPVQIGFAESVEPITPQKVTITRKAITTEADAERKETEMGRKYIVPYGLYRVEGHVSASLARKVTGFTEDDLALFWDALMNMFENDHSAARGEMTSRKLFIFKHDSELGNARASKLFDLVKAERTDPDSALPARDYKDYVVTVNEDALPEGVTLEIRE